MQLLYKEYKCISNKLETKFTYGYIFAHSREPVIYDLFVCYYESTLILLPLVRNKENMGYQYRCGMSMNELVVDRTL